MIRHLLVTLAATTALAATARAAAPQPHVRGTVVEINATNLVVHNRAGNDVTLALNDATHYVKVRKASLDDINKNTFIGTATKNVGSTLVALEVVVFPDSMRGTGEGHYGWDKLPDTTQSGGGMVSTSMTNGTVAKEASPHGQGMVNTSMTNGTVASDSGSGQVKNLTVTYKGGEKHIVVPPNVPIVTLAPGEKAEVQKGDAVVVVESKHGGHAASAVLFGVDGVKPPM